MFCAKCDTCVWSRKVDESSTSVGWSEKSNMGINHYASSMQICQKQKELSSFQQEWWCNMLQIPAHQLLLHVNKYTQILWRTAYVPSSSTALRCAEHQRKHNCVLDVLTLAAYGGCWLRQHGHNTSSVDDTDLESVKRNYGGIDCYQWSAQCFSKNGA